MHEKWKVRQCKNVKIEEKYRKYGGTGVKSVKYEN